MTKDAASSILLKLHLLIIVFIGVVVLYRLRRLAPGMGSNKENQKAREYPLSIFDFLPFDFIG